MPEAFDVKKLVTSPFTGLYWVKSVMYGLGIGMLIFVAYGLYKAYIKRPEPTTEQKADVIYNRYYQPRQTFGCMRFIPEPTPEKKGQVK